MQYVVSGARQMMLPSDISLLRDPLYKSLVNQFAQNATYLTQVFRAAWYKLTTRDMGPVSRCLNVSIGGMWQLPPAQPFQFPLPSPPSSLPDFDAVADAVRALLYVPVSSVPLGFAADYIGGRAYWGAMFSHAAFQCAATFRDSDKLGGCNGARIRLAPQSGWVFNKGVSSVLNVLEPVKQQFGPSLSYADLLVVAGNVAIEDASGVTLKFCGGRSDAAASYPDGMLQPGFNWSDTTVSFKFQARMRGLTVEELVAVSARPRSFNQMQRSGYLNATWSEEINVVSNEYFQVLLNETWLPVEGPSGTQYAAGSRALTSSDMQLLWDPVLKNVAQSFASDETLFLTAFASAWTKM